MKVINKSFVVLSFLLTGSFINAQSGGSAGSADTDSINVSATVGQGTSSIAIIEESITFENGSGGSTLIPTDSNSRFLSEAVTIEYFAANGPWEIRVYTQNANDTQGLVSTTEDSTATIPLKVTPGVENDSGVVEFGDITNDADWAGDDAELKFFRVLDDDTKEADTQNPFYGIVASSENENPNKDESFQVKFGIDVAGVAAEEYVTEVIFDLAIL